MPQIRTCGHGLRSWNRFYALAAIVLRVLIRASIMRS
jgi:hypothetical protein